ncbi:MAG TPA: purine nucleoside permease [Candidatus Acidoferrales bacterium]|jgi:purine nucleoside permease|nr:purine nucleoside permease [Candidatus Acidoferrales bacterium]
MRFVPKCIWLGLVIALSCAAVLRAQGAAPAAAIHVKVVVVTMFEAGEDTGDRPGEYQLWVEREHLDQILPLAAGYHHVRMNKDGVLGLLTGVGTARAAASVMALGTDPRFDFSKAYWIVAGIGGGDPADVSLGSAVWADHVVDGDLAYEIDAREIPKDWPTGYVPLQHATPYEQPVRQGATGEIYTLNRGIVGWAYQLTHGVALADTPGIRAYRSRFVGFPNALKPPFVARGDDMCGSTFWHGTRMDEWANAWVRYFTEGQGNFMVSAMEDTGTLQALTFLSQAGRVDLNRMLVLRTVSNYDREPPGVTPAESLAQMAKGNYPAYIESIEAAETVGEKVVRDIVAHWPEREKNIPSAP